MIVEEANLFIEQLLQKESWRQISGSGTTLCDGEIVWDGSPYWMCKTCGRIGRSHYQAHLPVPSKWKCIQAIIREVVSQLVRPK